MANHVQYTQVHEKETSDKIREDALIVDSICFSSSLKSVPSKFNNRSEASIISWTVFVIIFDFGKRKVN